MYDRELVFLNSQELFLYERKLVAKGSHSSQVLSVTWILGQWCCTPIWCCKPSLAKYWQRMEPAMEPVMEQVMEPVMEPVMEQVMEQVMEPGIVQTKVMVETKVIKNC